MSILAELLAELQDLVQEASLKPDTVWTEVATTWPVVVVSRETEQGHLMADAKPLTQLHLACQACVSHPSVFCLSPNASEGSYLFNDADLLAGILAHIRRSHPDVVAS